MTNPIVADYLLTLLLATDHNPMSVVDLSSVAKQKEEDILPILAQINVEHSGFICLMVKKEVSTVFAAERQKTRIRAFLVEGGFVKLENFKAEKHKQEELKDCLQTDNWEATIRLAQWGFWLAILAVIISVFNLLSRIF